MLDVLPEADVEPAEQKAQFVASVVLSETAPARAYLPAGHDKGKQEALPASE